MNKKLTSVWHILRDTFSDFGNDKVLKYSASLAYYTVFSLAPMLVVIIGLCSIFYGKDAIEGRIFGDLESIVGIDAAKQIEDVLSHTTLHNDNFFVTIIGFVTLLVGATGIFGEIQDSINAIWGLKANPKRGFIKILLNRLISFSMIIVLGFVLLVSLVLNALLSGLFHRLENTFSTNMVQVSLVLDYMLMLVVITALFACIFKVLPDARIKWRDVLMGSVVTALLFMLGKFAIGFFMQKNNTISAYGAAGSVIVLLLWVYYSAIILYFGAEFTKVYVKYKGRHIQPNKYATWVETKLVEKSSNTEVDSSKKTEIDHSEK